MSFPRLEPGQFEATRDALHAYAIVLGNWLKQSRPKRKHWWHASLRPSLRGLTTGLVHDSVTFELELNMSDSLLEARTDSGAYLAEALVGQSAAGLADLTARFLSQAGVNPPDVPVLPNGGALDYDPAQARLIGSAFLGVTGALARFRANIAEETSPIQVWPHHFDLSMLWLPGEQIPGRDADNEEDSDKQMNFGFVLGDTEIAEPYFYVTAYPSPEAMAGVSLPPEATWRTEGFTGAVLPYDSLMNLADPEAYLLSLWHDLLHAGREHLIANKTRGLRRE